jgi:patatin-like phospholipase/acyl hydrolase
MKKMDAYHRAMTYRDKLKDRPQRRLLALDGGGIRGMITIEVLARIEKVLQKRLGRDDTFVLAEYFDAIAGTSTGAIIATCLSLGKRVDEIRKFYIESGPDMFRRAPWYRRHLRNKVLHQPLAEKLKEVIGGADVKFGSDTLQTLLMIVLRNATTDSPWPLLNNPDALFCAPGPMCNLEMPLWQLVRASTAAPTYFQPEVITLGGKSFVFVDGGVTMYNNPAFQLFLMCTVQPYNLNWRTGEREMLLVSIGTGTAANANARLSPEDMHTLYSAKSVPAALMFAATNEQDFLCRVFGKCLAGDEIDMEVGDMIDKEGPARPKLFTYARYNGTLTREGLDALGLADVRPEAVQALDSTQGIGDLQRVGTAIAEQIVHEDHFDGFLIP